MTLNSTDLAPPADPDHQLLPADDAPVEPGPELAPVDIAAAVDAVTAMDWLFITRRFECTVEEATSNPLILLIVAAWMTGRAEHPGMEFWQNQTPSWLKDYLRIPDDDDDQVDPVAAAQEGADKSRP